MTQRIKYHRTMHLPYSPGTQSDDRLLKNVDHFVGKQVIVTEKMDGENTSMYRDFVHARSLDSNHHPSRTVVKQLQGTVGSEIPEHYRVCGENMYARHSIAYTQLEAYFLVFSIWYKNISLAWNDVEEISELLDLKTVPVLYKGIWDRDIIDTLYVPNREPDLMEGYVVRLAGQYRYEDSATSIAKYVRKGHVQTDQHWMNQMVVPNKLKE